MNKLKTEKRKAIIAALMEGMGVNAISRITGVCKEAILKLQKDLGCACAAYHHEHVRGLKPERVECDEIWAFNYCKAKNVSKTKKRDISYGDTWLWTAIDANSKLMITYFVGLRSSQDAHAFMDDLSGRVIDIGTLTTDGYGPYPQAVQAAFGLEVPYAQLVKHYDNPGVNENRYSPGSCVGCEKRSVIGFPHADHISTSIIERSNLTLRMSLRRFTRLTNAHSKKIENHGHAVALFFMYYNYCRKHETLKGRTPAMAAGLADHRWTLEELIGLVG